MRIVVPLSDEASIVFSHDECNFLEVLNTFKTAKWIDISTYSISLKDALLLPTLQKVDKSVPVRLVTNIPAHFDRYFGDRKTKFKEQLETYRARLDPKQYAALASFFNVSNHSKIIMTDTMAYIGSANYTPESANSFECGVLVTDAVVIAQLREEIFDHLVEVSAPQDMSEIRIARLWFENISNEFDTLLKSLSEELPHDNPKEFHEFLLWKDAVVPIELLARFATFLDEWETAHEDYRDHPRLGQIFDSEATNLIDKCRKLVEDDESPLVKLANFSEEEATSRHFEEYAHEAFDEKVDVYMSQAADDAMDERVELIESSTKVVEQLRQIFMELANLRQQLGDKLTRLEKTVWGVNNATS